MDHSYKPLDYHNFYLAVTSLTQSPTQIQECIPVGCIPSAAMAGGGGVCLGGVYPSVQRGRPPVDRQTPVKTLPFRNYCCGR